VQWPRLFRLRTILLSFSLVVLLIPLGSLYLFRLFEDELVLRTELELIAQSAVLAAHYKQQVLALDADQASSFGQKLRSLPQSDEYYQPIKPMLSLSTADPLPRRPNPHPAFGPTNSAATAIGEAMEPILRDTQRVMLAGMRVLDWRGVVIAGRNEVGTSLAHVKEVVNAMQGRYSANIRQRISSEPEPALSSISRGSQIRIFTAYPILHEKRLLGIIYLSRSPENILRFLYQERERVIWPTLMIVLLTFLLAIVISSRIVRPIKALIRQTERVASDVEAKIKPIKKPGTYELAQLSESFAQMSNCLYERTRYIEEFATHVSHEFKTPLTAMQGALELLLDHPDMPSTQQQRFLNNLLSDTDRLKTLVTGLLELARADSQQALQVSTTLGPVLDELAHIYGNRGLNLTVGEGLSDLRLAIETDALKTILGNLMANSLEQGADRVVIEQFNSTKNEVTLSLLDNGPGISPANQEHIFTPFFTTRRHQGGTGLGLGIVQSLLKAYHGKIVLGESEQGARFLVLLISSPP
jgi:signal transduction histidine kinase